MLTDIALTTRDARKAGLARELASLTKPRITAMVLLTTAGGLWLARARIEPLTWALTMIGVGCIVAGANTLNMYLERDTDALMKRTANRPLPAKRLSPQVALWFGVILSALSVPVLAIGVNPTTALLAVLANIIYVLGYTPLKRRTHWALQVGAIPGAIPPLLGWTAATGKVELAGLALFTILFAWQIAHFHAIALFRKGDYARAGLVVMPNALGDNAARHAIVRWAGVLLACSLALVPLGVAHLPYLVVATLLGAGFLVITTLGLRRAATMRSARGAFAASLFYLVLLLATIVIDGLVAG